MLEFVLELNVLFLQFTDKVFLKLDFFNGLHEIGIGLGGFVRESVSVLLEVENLVKKISDGLLLGSTLFLEHGNIIVLLSDLLLVLDIFLLSLFDGL